MQERGKLDNGFELAYGFGLRYGKWRGVRTVGHGGSWVGYRAALECFPDRGIAIACLANRSDVRGTPTAQRVAEVVLAEHLEPAPEEKEAEKESAPAEKTAQAPPAASPPADLAAFAGGYYCKVLNVAVWLRLVEDRLDLLCRGRNRGPLVPVHEDAFRALAGRIALHRTGTGQPAGFTYAFGGQRYQFRRLRE